MKSPRRGLWLVLGMVGCSLTSLAMAEESGMAVEKAWVREAPPAMQVTAAYMVLKNASAKPVVLTSVTTPDFAKVELHETVQHQGQAHMQAVKELSIPARGHVTLQPGGHHLMLIAPQKNTPLRTGDQVSLTLTFKEGKPLTVTAMVKKDIKSSSPTDADHTQHMDQKHGH
ncbi:MAG: copper chaperone PCu(A)C [Magnetococcales bacterium]|nr:copper chaperone PCu(A)C [Magnetococcales bacterium]